MARRSGANGWIIKPLDALRLRKAVNAIVAGGCYAEGIPTPDAIVATYSGINVLNPVAVEI